MTEILGTKTITKRCKKFPKNLEGKKQLYFQTRTVEQNMKNFQQIHKGLKKNP